MMRYSVLMSVYGRESAYNLEQSILSLMCQSIPAGEVILVCDGPLTDELEAVINLFKNNQSIPVFVHRLHTQSGLGVALRQGVLLCKYDFIARMDSDDIAKPERCERQLRHMNENALDLCSSFVDEFIGDPNNVVGRRAVPQHHEDIVRYARRRNPINHPCVMFRKKAVIDAGNYSEMPYYEDYNLWMRMIQNGAKVGNIPESLLLMRITPNSYRRRGGLQYCKATFRFWLSARKQKQVSDIEFIEALLLRIPINLLPNGIRSAFYQKLLRRNGTVGKVP